MEFYTESAGDAGCRFDAGFEMGAGFQNKVHWVFMLSTAMISVVNYCIFAF